MGANGAGKTSLLEAVYLLATTRSFRAARLAECARHGGGSFSLEGRVEDGRRTDLAVGWGEGGKWRTVNGSETPLAEHLAVLPVAAWTSGDAELVGGAPSARRRFLDQGVVGLQPAALETLARYRRVLDQKRRLLASGGGGLEPWNELLAAAAAELIGLRRRFVELLRVELDELLGSAGEGLPPIDVHYRPSPADGAEGEAAIRRRLEVLRTRERQAGGPLVGPHRDELEISWAGHEARRGASAGERKLVGLALIASRGRVRAQGRGKPLVLLDDLGAELDRNRLVTAWRLFADTPQLVAASSRPELAGEIDAGRVWRVADGLLRPSDGGS